MQTWLKQACPFPPPLGRSRVQSTHAREARPPASRHALSLASAGKLRQVLKAGQLEAGGSLHPRQLNRRWFLRANTSGTPPRVPRHFSICTGTSPRVKTNLVALFHSCFQNLLNPVKCAFKSYSTILLGFVTSSSFM